MNILEWWRNRKIESNERKQIIDELVNSSQEKTFEESTLLLKEEKIQYQNNLKIEREKLFKERVDRNKERIKESYILGEKEYIFVIEDNLLPLRYFSEEELLSFVISVVNADIVENVILEYNYFSNRYKVKLKS